MAGNNSGYSLQVTPAGPVTTEQQNELNFRGLYLRHTPAGPNPTQATVAGGNAATGLGETVVNNWPIHDGPGPYGTNVVVARAQGLHVQAGGWHNSFTIAFEDTRFRGSTLQVMGLSVEEGEWSIVGGTGQFAMARGIIYKRMHSQGNDGNVIELTIHGFCPVSRGSQQYPGSQPMGMGQQQYPGSYPMGTGPQQYPGSNPMGSQQYHGPQQMGMGPQQYPGQQPMGMGPQHYPGQQPMGPGFQQYPMYNRQPAKNGPWGGIGGSPRDITDAPQRLESITVRSGWVIDSLTFSYINQAGQRRTAGPWGGSGGDENRIYLGPSEFVTEVSGTTGAHENRTVVRSLKIVTNMRTYGPFGRDQADGYSAPYSSNGSIVGFFGRSGDNLDSIGTYTV